MIGILDLNLGNLKSVFNAIYELGFDPILVDQASHFDELSHLIIPGVGSYPAAMNHYDALQLKDKLAAYVASLRPVLGICLGMQIFSDWGEEIVATKGLGLISGRVVKLPQNPDLLVPHVGWNTVDFKVPHVIFDGIKNHIDFYFVHSYHYVCAQTEEILAVTAYGINFASVVGKNNIVGVQFHPEKSQKNGLKLLENFCHWNGR